MSDKKKVSMYTLFIPREDGTYVVANTLSAAIVHINEKAYIDRLEEMMSDLKDGLVYDADNDMHEHFYESGIIVDEDVDEYSLALYAYEQRVVRDNKLNLTLLTTRQCNFRCVYCYEDFRDEHMSGEVYDNLLCYIEKSLQDKLYNGVHISLFGGEPFLPFNDVIDFLKKAKEICERYDMPFTSSATTNFSVVTPERFDMLAQVNCNFYQVTIDGLPDDHNSRRVMVGGGGSFDAIVKNLKYAKSTEHEFKICIRTNFDEDSIQRADDFYPYIKENFDDPRFSIFFMVTTKLGGENNNSLNLIEGDAKVEAAAHVSTILAKLNLKNAISHTYTLPFHDICYACKHNHFVVDVDGAIKKCTVILDDKINNVGQLRPGGVLDIDHNEHSKWVCKHTQFTPECKDCDVFPICFGVNCPLNSRYNKNRKCNKEGIRRRILNECKFSE